MSAESRKSLSSWLEPRVAVVTVVICVGAIALAGGEEPAPASAGRIEGRVGSLVEHSGVKTGVRVVSIRLFTSRARKELATAPVDDDGMFVFDRVPPGPVELRPQFEIPKPAVEPDGKYYIQSGIVELTRGLTLPATVKAGETTRVTLFGKGRPIVGRIVPPRVAGITPDMIRVTVQLRAEPFRQTVDREGRVRGSPSSPVWSLLTARNRLVGLDDELRFRIPRVTEGIYRVYAWVPGEFRPDGKSLRLIVEDSSVEKSPVLRRYGELTVPLLATGTTEEPLDLGTIGLRVESRPGGRRSRFVGSEASSLTRTDAGLTP